MRKLTTAILVATMSLCLQPAFAATTQQEKMKTCNADAAKKELKGDARKAFMKDCLSAAGAAATKTLSTQQQKMKDCNADAGKQQLKGDARKSFMKDCLSGKSGNTTN